VRAYTNSTTQSQKMLASTVQFSTYDQTPATRPHQTHALPQETQRYEIQTGPAETNEPPVTRNSPLPQDPTACLRPPPRSDSGPRPPHGKQY
jgi:hypothetical protein